MTSVKRLNWHYYDKQGNPIDRDEVLRLWSDPDYRFVAVDTLPNGVKVSTVWTGIDYSLYDDVKPLIFETMIFGGERDTYAWRYTTEAEALEGHRQVVEEELKLQGAATV